MKKLKRVTSLVLIAAMTLSLAACGKKEETQPTTQATEETVATTEEATTEEEEETGGNLLKNGDISDGDAGYSLYLNGGDADKYANEDGQLQIDIRKTGMVEHGVQVYQDGFKLRQNAVYQFSFDVSSTLERDFEWRFQLNGGDYHAYYAESVDATPEMQHIDVTFTMEEDTDPAPRLCFNLGYSKKMTEENVDAATIGEHTILLDNLSLTCVDDSNATPEPKPIEIPNVKINQLGYTPDAMKIAVFGNIEEEDLTFSVVNVDTNETVYEGDMSKRVYNAGADERNSYGDFSEVKEKGTYKVVSSGGAESHTFTIGEDPYPEVFDNVVKMLYLQRCGCELTKDLAGDFAHPECHTGEAVIYGTNNKIDVSGGWHDAGDYGRYVVSGAKAVADLLLAYECNKDAFTDNMGIPESGDGVSDILNEVKYELDWMKKMQDSNGGVYHKVTCEMFPDTVMPEEETDQLIVCPISNTATGAYAAVMAMASRIYDENTEGAFKGEATAYLDAAKKAYAYLGAHLEDGGFTNPEEIVTGEYPDVNCIDEYYWAAAELYKATGDTGYMKDIEDHITDIKNYTGLGWADVSGYASYALLTADGASEENADVYKKVYDIFMNAADTAVETSGKNGYLVNREKTYEWGSNMGICNSGMLLMMANKINAKADYVTFAKHHLDYIFGVNATGYSFVTGTGILSPTDTHHRPSMVVGKTMPGMLVGGPDGNLEDPYAAAVCYGMPAAKCYADSAQSFSCNEITVYWNSPLIYLMAAVEE